MPRQSKRSWSTCRTRTFGRFADAGCDQRVRGIAHRANMSTKRRLPLTAILPPYALNRYHEATEPRWAPGLPPLKESLSCLDLIKSSDGFALAW
jgi:hypothetical protein